MLGLITINLCKYTFGASQRWGGGGGGGGEGVARVSDFFTKNPN